MYCISSIELFAFNYRCCHQIVGAQLTVVGAINTTSRHNQYSCMLVLPLAKLNDIIISYSVSVITIVNLLEHHNYMYTYKD